MFNESRFTTQNWRYWTRGAVECYNRSCICKDCPIKDVLTSQSCRMKYAVISLVRTNGRPPALVSLEEENKLVDKIALGLDNGYNLKQIASQLNMSYVKLQRTARQYGLDTTRNKNNWRKCNERKSKQN